MASNLVIQHEITQDEDYLRDDEDIIKSFLNGEKPILATCGPRRSGKTSFLKRIERWAHKEEESAKKWAGDKKMDAVYLTFETSIDDVLNVLGDKFKTKLVKPRDFLNVLAKLDHTVFFLLDECYAGITNQKDGKENRDIINLIITRVGIKGNVKVAIADVPKFFEICHNEQQGIDAVVFDNPWLLPPITEIRKEQHLIQEGEELLGFKDLVGNIPIEVQLLRKWYSDKKEFEEEINDPVKDEDILIKELVGEMRYTFSSIFTTLKDEHKDLLRAVCFGEVKKDMLKGIGENPLTELGLKRGFGMLEIDRLELIKIASPAFKAWISETQQPPSKEKIGGILINFEGNDNTPSGPRPTFLGGLVIHQISDLHFGKYGYYDKKGRHLAYSYLDFLKSVGGDSELRPHIIIICGDLTSEGNNDEFKQACKFLTDIKEIKTRDDHFLLRPFYEGGSIEWENQILLVPGNHETFWIDDPKKKPPSTFEIHNVIQQFKNPYSDVPAIFYGHPLAVSIILLNSAEKCGMPFSLAKPDSKDKAKTCTELEKRIRDSYKDIFDGLISVSQNLSESDKSAMLQNWVRFTSGYITPENLDSIQRSFETAESSPVGCHDKDNNDSKIPLIRFAVCHHNLYNIFEPKLFTDMVNCCDIREEFVKSNVSILLYGHTHQNCISTELIYKTDVSNERIKSKHAQFHSIGVGSLGISPGNATFNEIRIHPILVSEQGQISREVTVRTFSQVRDPVLPQNYIWQSAPNSMTLNM